MPHTLELDMRPYLESDATRTMEIIARDDAALDEHDHGDHGAYAEPHATTMSIPVVGASSAVVLDDPEPGQWSEASLVISSGRAKWGLFTLAAGAFAMGVNEATIVALSTDISSGLGIPVAQVGLLATAFSLTVVLTAIPLTFLTKRWSRRLSLTAAMTVWSIGLLIAATSSSMGQLAAGRVTSGLAHALFWALVAPTAASLFAPHLRPKTVTGVMLGAAAAGVIGTPLVTASGTALGWQIPFAALAILGFSLAIALGLVLPSTTTPGGATSHTVGDLPSRQDFFRVLAVTFLVSMGMAATWTYIVPFFTEVAGLRDQILPLIFAFGGLLAVAATMAVGTFLIRHAVRTVAVGTAMVAVAWLILWIGQPWSAIVAQGLQAAGWAVLIAALLNWAMRHTPFRTELAGGMYTTTANAGAATGPIVGAVIVSGWGTQALPLVSFVIFSLAILVTVTVDRRTRALLNVPRQVREAQTRLARLQQRRSAWEQREKELGIRRRKRGLKAKQRAAVSRTSKDKRGPGDGLQSMHSIGYGPSSSNR
ncbi:MFS transporter [Demequina sp. B12]|uniref:MFS transporter n=1 Tax=Demequina sp. B12 TaxID=2992757 RepID=UPI00237AFFF5|nr:MFS transporter [Demequina sp. B12]MDE0573448.1 MFS transporter [Demequina sp. B12]